MRRSLIVLAVLVCIGPAGPVAHATVPHRGNTCRSQACVQRVAARFCAHGRVVSCIHRGALRWRVSYVMLRRKAWCESRMNPFAQNQSGAVGLFQFLPSTWASTPYAGRSIWSPKWAALGAGWMHAVGRGGEWSCR
jgi:hypothetical protein